MTSLQLCILLIDVYVIVYIKYRTTRVVSLMLYGCNLHCSVINYSLVLLRISSDFSVSHILFLFTNVNSLLVFHFCPSGIWQNNHTVLVALIKLELYWCWHFFVFLLVTFERILFFSFILKNFSIALLRKSCLS